MAEYRIENENIAICVHSFGAELKSLKKKSTDTEYMWCADAAYWGRTAPVLFPFVGSVNQNEFRTKGKTYCMGQHGFARDMEFTLLSESADELWFVLKSNAQTLEKYPYEFVLKIGYRLTDNGVEVIWRVENPGNEDLLFSIGGHPAFNRRENCCISMDEEDCIVSTLLRDGLATSEKITYKLEQGYLAVTDTLFDKDALILEQNQAKRVSLCEADGNPYLTVVMTAPLFGIWSPPKKNAPFICIEPWYGRCDREGFNGELCEREWGNQIAPSEIWQEGFSIIV